MEASKRDDEYKAKLKIPIKKLNRNTTKNDRFLCYNPPLTAEVQSEKKKKKNETLLFILIQIIVHK